MTNRPIRRRKLWAAAGLLAFAALGGPALAVDRALLVGVSDYPALPRRLWLNGPINDVALMRQTLLARGMSLANMRTLVSRAQPDDEPTRAHITQAMQQLVLTSKAGDRIVFYLSGHGSQQPQPREHGQRPTETDGLDEVFLPSDVRQWDGQGSRAEIPNALLDDEIGEWIDALVDRGAIVWAVFDTCHAAGMARGDGGTWRGVSGAELGLPPVPSSRRTSANTPAPSNRGPGKNQRTDGRTLAFAARANELTGEEWLPRGAGPQGSRIQGVFTFHLTSAWMQDSTPNNQSLESTLRQKYRQEQRVSPTPIFQGPPAQAWP